MLEVAHRGDPAHTPENTLASFVMAWRHGRRAFECDLRASRDGVPVVIHDATLERTMAGHGPVANQPWRRLRALGVPLLADLLAAWRGRPVTLFLDVKVAGIEAPIVRAIRRAGMSRCCRIASSHGSVLRRFRRLNPRLPRYRVTGSSQPITLRMIRGALRERLTGLIVAQRWMTPAAVQALRAVGLERYLWTVRRAHEARRAQALDLTGIMTERCLHPST